MDFGSLTAKNQYPFAELGNKPSFYGRAAESVIT